MPSPELRSLLLECFQSALAAVDARRCVRDRLATEAPTGRWHLVAVGKAAGAMSLGAVDHFGERLAGGVVVTKADHVPAALRGRGGFTIVESAHPLPDERSLVAGAAVENFILGLPEQARLLFLVSGGASSLVELLVPGVGLDDLQAVNAWALASGRPIAEVNAVRRCLSRIKGGGLAAMAGRRLGLALMISDVPHDDPAVIGSGLLHPPAADAALPHDLPSDLAALVEKAKRRRPVASAHRRVPCRIVASVGQARRAAAQRAVALGFEARISSRRFSGDAGRLGRRFARVLCDAPERVLQVWGGESTVVLPQNAGRGGRNQHLSLSAAVEIAGRTSVALLAAGTDGIDGVTQDAGAVVDGGTCERGRDAGYDPLTSLARADSGAFLEGSGDLLHTGPTLTNVGDLVLGLKGRP